MTTKELWKALGLAFELWLFYVISTSIFNVSLDSASLFPKLIAFAILCVCLFVFFSTEYRRLFKKKPKFYTEQNLSNAPEARKAVEETAPKVFKKDLRELNTQIQRMDKKSSQIDDALRSYFGGSKISYEKFASTVEGVKKIFYSNVQAIINRINIFDEAGYEQLFARHREHTPDIEPYNRSLRFVENRLEENEEILKKLDALLLEVTRLSENTVPVEELPEMKELSDLTKLTMRYKQN